MLMFVLVLFFLLIIMMNAFHLFDPFGRSGHLLHVEEMRVENLFEVNVAEVARDDLRLRLEFA